MMIDKRMVPALAGRLRPYLVQPPEVTDDASCQGCLSWKNPQYDYCFNCTEIIEAFGDLQFRPRVITLYSRPSVVRDLLKHYKPGPGYVRSYEVYLTALIAHYLDTHAGELEHQFGSWDALCVVPSSWRSEAHPLRNLVTNALSVTGNRYRLDDSLARGPGPVGHRVMSRDAFVVNQSSPRVLLVDDVLTTGSTAHSAAAALRDAGVEVVGGLIVGRRVNPQFNQFAEDFWQARCRASGSSQL